MSHQIKYSLNNEQKEMTIVISYDLAKKIRAIISNATLDENADGMWLLWGVLHAMDNQHERCKECSRLCKTGPRNDDETCFDFILKEV